MILIEEALVSSGPSNKDTIKDNIICYMFAKKKRGMLAMDWR